MDSSMLWSGFRGALATVDHDMVRERLLRQGSLASVASEDGEMDAAEIEAMIAAEVAAVETKMRDESEIQRAAEGLPTAKDRAKTIPLRRAGLPSDIAKTVAFLASDEADYITGETISVTGGIWND